MIVLRTYNDTSNVCYKEDEWIQHDHTYIDNILHFVWALMKFAKYPGGRIRCQSHVQQVTGTICGSKGLYKKETKKKKRKKLRWIASAGSADSVRIPCSFTCTARLINFDGARAAGNCCRMCRARVNSIESAISVAMYNVL